MKLYEDSDYKMIAEWCGSRGIPVPPKETFPSIGFVCENIACGFLLIMDNGCAMIDFLITNPFSSKEQRDEMIDIIVDCLKAIALEMGIKFLMASTKIEAVKKRALKHEFIYTGEYSNFILEL